MGMDPVQWVFLGLQLIGQISQLSVIIWFFSGGWKFVLRTIGFDIDTLLVNVIARVYEYFLQVLNGDMFNEDVVNALLKNVYVFIGVIMFFRLMMLIIKYLINPDLVGDNKIGVNALVKRVIIGLMGIIFIPTLFDLALDLQAHILQDNIIQQVIVPADMLDAVKEKQKDGGKYIGTYVLAGFISPGENASSKTKTEYENALADGDLSGLSTLKKDGFLVGEYEYDYFYLLSTFCLCYVLYILIKYTLDVITRFLRMLMYQMLAPIAMIEYMINGADDGVFKAWKTGILGTYFMLFIRVLALWFVIFITVLMTSDKNNLYVKGSLLASDDYLLRAFIIMAVIGFMMDLPKLVGQVFGLDFEQEGNAGGLLKQVGGMVKGAAMGAIAMGGAAVGGAIGTGKAAFGATKAGKKWDQAKKDVAQKKPGLMGTLNASKAGMSGILGAAMNSNQFTGAATRGYQGVTQQQQQQADKAKADEAKREEERRAQKQREEDVTRNVTERVIESLPKDTPMKDIKANVIAQMFGDPGEVTAKVNGQLSAITSTGQSVDVGTVTQTVNQVLGERFDVSPSEVEQVIKQVVKDPANVTPTEVDQIVNQVIGNRVAASEETITQVVNQVYGTRVNNAVDDATQKVTQEIERVNTTVEDATQKVTQQLDQVVTNTEEINVYSEISTEHIEHMRQQVDLQRNNNNNP
ncbi:MAG: hypothetical protein E7162_06280 [Firmicutes bacterium]|nr:hypothetical protein [Bacillota bacterium]